MIRELIEKDEEHARIAMNAIWGICQKLHKRHIDLITAINAVGAEYEDYMAFCLLNRPDYTLPHEPDGLEVTEPTV
jgi:hypothetical protein